MAKISVEEAQNNVGVCYVTGYGVERDMKQTVEWYALVAGKGYLYSLTGLAKPIGRMPHTYFVALRRFYRIKD